MFLWETDVDVNNLKNPQRWQQEMKAWRGNYQILIFSFEMLNDWKMNLKFILEIQMILDFFTS